MTVGAEPGAIWAQRGSHLPSPYYHCDSRSTGWKPMSTPSQGTSGPSGHTGLRPTSSPLFGGNYVVSQPASTQTSPEQSMANQIRKLTVRVLTPLFFGIIQAHETLDDASTMLKRSWHYTRYNRWPCFSDENPPNLRVGIVRDKGTDGWFIERTREAGPRGGRRECGS